MTQPRSASYAGHLASEACNVSKDVDVTNNDHATTDINSWRTQASVSSRARIKVHHVIIQ